jgi:hypothetical protein
VTVGRITPYEVAFGERRFAEEEFPALAAESDRRGLGAGRYDQFTLLERVAGLLEQVLPDDARAPAIDQYVQILYHCYHFWSAGCPLYAFEMPVLRGLIEMPPDLRKWSPRVRESSQYLELPKNLFWAQVSAAAPPEPVEGMFVTHEVGRPLVEADILVVLGLRPDRPGFSVAGLRLEPDVLGELDEPARFQSDIPGAEQAGLYSLQRNSEVATLALRALWYLDAHPASCEPVKGSGGRGGRERGGATALDHFRVTKTERSYE